MKQVLSPHQNSRLAVILFAAALITLWGSAAMAMTLNSPAFHQNGHIPSKYTCEGQDISPPLAWDGVPNGAKSLVLIVDDPDALPPSFHGERAGPSLVQGAVGLRRIVVSMDGTVWSGKRTSPATRLMRILNLLQAVLPAVALKFAIGQ
jgi:Phosphatidylethanolamine-binding protein